MNKTNNPKQGAIVIINTLLFLVIATLIIIGVTRPVLASYSSSKAFTHSKQSFLLANSAAEEALYRLRTNKNLSSSETLTFSSSTYPGSVTIAVSNTVNGKDISIASNVDSFKRDMNIELAQEVGVSFTYGLQAGLGGYQMDGGATINGSVYSNGDIIGSGGPRITGSATVANVSSPTLHQTNGTTLPPPHSINFGGSQDWQVSYPQDFAQSFRVSTTSPVSAVRFYIKRNNTAWRDSTTVKITNDSSGKPGNSTLASGTLDYTQVTTGYNYVTIQFATPVTLSANTTYWVVLDTGSTYGSYFTIGASSQTYANGQAKTSTGGSTWIDTSPTGLDSYFGLYTGGDTGLISGITINGDAWSREIKNSTLTANAYCQSWSNNNKNCNTTRPDPTPQPFPISESNLTEWKDQATAGGVQNGNLSYGSNQNVSIGPKKIDGNLTVSGGATLTVTGTLWVTGTITLDGGGIIKLSPSYGATSGIIVADGRIIAGGGGQFQGNGSSGSYILVVTTSNCPISSSCNGSPAVSVSGGTGSVILNAQNGTLSFDGGASAKQATANKIIMSGGTTVNYETGLADIQFNGAPAGSWNLVEWREE